MTMQQQAIVQVDQSATGSASTLIADNIHTEGRRWTFGNSTPENFADHVNRSIPLYLEGHQLICGLSDYFISEGGLCYELGCSVGDLAAKLASRHKQLVGTSFVGLDDKEGMILQATARFGQHRNLIFTKRNIVGYEFEPCDLVVSYYTLQFVQVGHRIEITRAVCRALKRNGAFIVFEKTNCNDGTPQDMLSNLYVDFKTQNGFTAEEILAKTASLKGVLQPLTGEENIEMLKEAGFKKVFTIAKFLQFEGYVAIK